LFTTPAILRDEVAVCETATTWHGFSYKQKAREMLLRVVDEIERPFLNFKTRST
jgi:hypothetical protein